ARRRSVLRRRPLHDGAPAVDRPGIALQTSIASLVPAPTQRLALLERGEPPEGVVPGAGCVPLLVPGQLRRLENGLQVLDLRAELDGDVGGPAEVLEQVPALAVRRATHEEQRR